MPIIDGLNPSKATGHDRITARAVKENKLVIGPILVFLINLTIKTSTFSDCLKIARVKPVYKKGSKKDKNNYRPISILSAISKIVERILTHQITEYLETYSILTRHQFGFRKGKNTTFAISNLMEQLYENFNCSTITQGIFLDFSKAFDTINHDILVQKLCFSGFDQMATQLILSYLSNRKQFVNINGVASQTRIMSIGVPQGSIIGPLLFLIYINDLLKAAPTLSYILYADDTNIFAKDPGELRNEIKMVEEWCLANKLVLNCTKTFQIIFKAPSKKIRLQDYTVNLTTYTLETKSYTKFLGIILDSNITFEQHIIQLCKKLKLILTMMRAVRPYFDQKTMIDLYYAFFYPHLIYGIEFWGHATATNIKRILVLQKATLRVILNKRPTEHVTTYFKALKIMPVQMLFEYCTLKLLLKTYSLQYLSTLQPKHDYNTRTNNLTIKKANNKWGERSLLCTGIALYNRYLRRVDLGGRIRPWDGLAPLLWETA